MYYVYLLRSLEDPSKTYIGLTTDIEQRFKAHNAGRSVHTAKYRPWKLVVYLAFESEQKASDFEKYIKIGSGHSFAKKRFW
jgi:predicted GIY-YIG superfamily endonuclease